MSGIVLDHIIVATPELEALGAWERLGLVLTEPAGHRGLGTKNRSLMAGASVEAMFYVEFLAVRDRAEAEASGSRGTLLAALDSGGGAYRLMLAVDDLEPYRAALGSAAGDAYEVRRDTGEKICDVLPVSALEAGCDIGLVRYAHSRDAMFAAREARGAFGHELPLRRMDHLAMITPNLDASTRWWNEALDVPLHGTVSGRGMVIHQLKMGDGILELIGPDSPESPLGSRPAGLISMAAFEVPSLDGAVAHARERGFAIGDPSAGVLPGTRTATISGDQLAGLSLQLLEYV